MINVEKVERYSVECDFCSCDYCNDPLCTITFFDTQEQAENCVKYDGWVQVNGQLYCPYCYENYIMTQ